MGAGFVVFAPPSVGHLPEGISLRDVALAADDAGSSSLLNPWIDQYNIASADATKLLNTFYDAPNVGLQQFLANMSGYLQDFLNDPTTTNNWAQQTEDNLAAVLTGYGLQNADANTTSVVLSHTLESVGLANGHHTLFGEIPGYIPADEQAAATPIINFLASPESGIIMGEIGPWISPWVALGDSISDGDGFNEILANTVGAFFNGADLNLDSLLPAINSAGLFPAGMSMVNLDIGFGGLLSPGSVGSTAVFGGGGVGGSLFNSVGIDFTGVPTVGTLDAPSQAIGPIGALESWGQIIAELLGWSGSGSPLADITLPVIPTDLLDSGAAAATAAADLSPLWQDLLAAF